MQKKKKYKRKPSKVVVSRSVAFKIALLDQLKEHSLCTKDDRSVSWIINGLIQKLLDGKVTLP